MSGQQGSNHGGPGRPGFQRTGVANPRNPHDAKLFPAAMVVSSPAGEAASESTHDDLAVALEVVKREKARMQAFEKLDQDTASRIVFQRSMDVTPQIQLMRDSYMEEAGKQLLLIRQNPQRVSLGLPHRAHLVSLYAHARQVDKLGIQYSFHPQGVVQLLKQSEEYAALTDKEKQDAVCAAYLHDVAEDVEHTGLTLDDLRELGFTDETIAIVDALSARPGEPKEDYYARVMAAGPAARAVKLADLGHNNLPSRRAWLPGSPTVPVGVDGRDDYARLGKKYAKAYKALNAAVPAHLQQFAV